ncbi:MAG: hypothetical protein WC897_01930 [Candidatus Gracilibacteria bacterium]
MKDPLIRAVKRIEHRKKLKPLSQEVISTYKILTITLAVLGLATMGSYLYLNTLKPAKGYELKQLQAEYEELQSDLRKINQQVIEAQSFVNLQETDTVNNMDTNDGQVSYTKDNSFAKNEGGAPAYITQ